MYDKVFNQSLSHPQPYKVAAKLGLSFIWNISGNSTSTNLFLLDITKKVPKDWKMTYVVLIFQNKIKKNTVANFCLVSLTAICSNIFEHNFHLNIMKHFYGNIKQSLVWDTTYYHRARPFLSKQIVIHSDIDKSTRSSSNQDRSKLSATYEGLHKKIMMSDSNSKTWIFLLSNILIYMSNNKLDLHTLYD